MNGRLMNMELDGNINNKFNIKLYVQYNQYLVIEDPQKQIIN